MKKSQTRTVFVSANPKEAAFMNLLIAGLPVGTVFEEPVKKFLDFVKKYVNKRRASELNFDLTYDEVKKYLIETKFVCGYEDVKMEIIPGVRKKGGNPMKFSIDKLDNDLDTYKNNFEPSTWRANRAKSTMSKDEFIDMSVNVAIASGRVKYV